ncbi:NAD-dependent epimerase/dehydratase family protein [Jhaorihella thermophila]|uniref:Uronate dehydrogenase n=1 Tax=Jhaorihella thermophila TaxID=488547 RepID=A0A1H5UH22_9RHOB|nr:NAD(P)-dependent oxidoreductase [Jhaorihella thermophila]SEF74340.1 uronate dehydrogenase [Jhaorihella thermophila]
MKRLLITGAAGGIGTAMRSRLAHLAETLRLADIAPIPDPAPNEEVVQCDLADRDAVFDMVAGCDGIVHLGGVPVERSFNQILNANIIGLFNLFEAARAHDRPRILFASSNHAIGYYRQTERLTAASPTKPDSLYGVSKVFGEALASMYFHKFGQETASVRIGSCETRPTDRRMLATWLSHDDFAALAERVFAVPRLGCPIIYGASANDENWWDNGSVSYLGWRPRDSSAKWRAEIEATTPRPAPDDPVALFQGGIFTQEPIHED